MKRLWLFTAIALVTLGAIAFAGFKNFTTQPGSAVLPTVVLPVDPAITALETEVARRDQDFSAQYQALQQTLEARRAEDEDTITHLLSDIAVAQTKVQALQGQQQTLSTQITALETTKTQSRTTYQQNLAVQRAEYERRIQTLETQLALVQAQLAQLQGKTGQ